MQESEISVPKIESNKDVPSVKNSGRNLLIGSLSIDTFLSLSRSLRTCSAIIKHF